MALNDTPRAYGIVSIFNHWVGVALIFTLLIIGLQFEDLPRGDERSALIALHMSIGILAFAWLAFRVLWRLTSGFPEEVPGRTWEQKLSRIVHWLLLAAIATAILSGPLSVLANGRGIDVFDWFTVPALLPGNRTLHEIFETMHAISAKPLLIVLLVLHIGGAFKHAVIDRDTTLARMLKPAAE